MKSEISDKITEIRLAIVGRPNVGKSTLFNRLLGRRRALVHDEPGVTRDRLEEKVQWWVQTKLVNVRLIDTGGLGGDRFTAEIEQQVKIGLTEADVVLMLMDAQAGVTPADRDVIRLLKTSGLLDEKNKVVLGVVNKIDDNKHEELVGEFYATGLEPILGVSAEHGRGIDDLKEAIVAGLEVRGFHFSPAQEEEPFELGEEPLPESPSTPDVPRIAIVGRPNVGKSTLVNALLGEERMIASPIAGTTIDAVDSRVELAGHEFIFIDTAGIRRKGKTEQGVEVLSVVQARKALERCHVAVLLLDGETGITDQDEKIGGLIEDLGCGVILAINKWDTQRKNQKFTKEAAAARIRKQMAFLRYAPLMFMSAKKGEGIEDLGELALEILEQRRIKIATKEFTEFVRREAEVHNPMNARFYMSHQSGRHPPTFVCHVSDPDKVHFSLRRHIMNALRERWGFMGNPVRLLFIQGGSDRKAAPKKARKSMSYSQRGHAKAAKEAKRHKR